MNASYCFLVCNELILLSLTVLLCIPQVMFAYL